MTTNTAFPQHILLIDRHAPLCDAWSRVFEDHDAIEVIEGDFFARDADAMVSPANSFGIMDGGLDRAIRDVLGGDIQRSVQSAILERHHGEIPVGAAEIVATGHARFRELVVAPTMRVPENVSRTLNAYLAFRAILLAVVRHNRAGERAAIRTLLVPGLGTGIGAMDAERCAVQMRLAYDHVSKPARIPSFSMIHEMHHRLRSS